MGFIERALCPGCGSESTDCLLSIPFDDASLSGFVRAYYCIDPARLSDAPYRLDRCRNCGLVFQRFVGDGELMAELYGSWAPTAERFDDIPELVECLENPRASRDGHELMAAAAFLGRGVDDLKVLDYGMGWGLWASIAKKLGADSYGTELSAKMISHAQARGVKIIQETAGEKFDFINLEQVVEHLPEPRGTLRLLSLALRPEGILKVSLPNASNAPQLVAAIGAGSYKGDYETIMPIQPLEHINSFTPRAVRIMADTIGLAPVKPTLRHRYAFLSRGGLPTKPARLAKELVRPIWEYHNPSNIHVWMRRIDNL